MMYFQIALLGAMIALAIVGVAIVCDLIHDELRYAKKLDARAEALKNEPIR